MATCLLFYEVQRKMLQIATRTPGAGEWLTKRPEFTRWRSGATRTLFCHGSFGTGKTVLMSIVIDHLLWNRTKDWNEGGIEQICLYTFLDGRKRDSEEQSLLNLLSTLLFQLFRQDGTHRSVADFTRRVYNDYKATGIKPTTDVYLKMLQSQITLRSPGRIYLIVDALDQCSDGTLTEFIQACQQLPQNVHMLFTSTFLDRFQDLLTPDETIPITAHDEDLKMFLENALRNPRFLQVLKDGTSREDNFKQRLLDTFVERSRKNFLPATLHLETLTRNSTEFSNFNRSLQNLSQTPDGFYKEAVRRIKLQGSFEQRLAKKVLSWLVFAERSLQLDELYHAITVYENREDIERGAYVLPKGGCPADFEPSLSKVCFGIVVVDNETKIVRLRHISAEKYLLTNETEMLVVKDAQSMITISCLTCLCHIPAVDDRELAPSLETLESRCKKYPFLEYAANHWGRHLSYGVNHETNILAWGFLTDQKGLQRTVQTMAKFAFRATTGITGMHIAAFFGLDALMSKAIRNHRRLNDKDARTGDGETVVHWAVRWRQREFLELLLEEDADARPQDAGGRTALHIAVANEDLATVKALLDCAPGRKPDLNLSDSDGWTALRYAAAKGLTRFVETLLLAGALVDDPDKNGWTALRWATDRGHVRVSEMLLDNKASQELKLPRGEKWTLLQWVAREGRDAIVRLLVERHADVDVPDAERGWTPLRWAVEHSRAVVAWQLLEGRADVNKADKRGKAPLYAAAERGDMNILWLLLEKRANPNVLEHEFGMTPLHKAAEKGLVLVVLLLLEKGCDAFETDKRGRTALHWAVQESHAEVVEVLLWKVRGTGLLMHMVDFEERTALHYAATQGHLNIVEILLQSVPA